ncbi:hypothetical protein OG601_47595 [Streptomyces sp. NBC_01239]|uniref:hypothetical protein n=1 Tax=Streptomyces sp. NBC_01239 TaxID=2903792 RepID=UPI0022526D89|nr:hypothetical protein [Streptomyces sp. NBC_01239]MCX4816792.1 hypothetical protein [Streptomyces sp. NBC_01239]MCX4818240.1 hypothetical protein [Streptomyces sp. NBC_01239]
MPEDVIHAAARAAEGERYQRWHTAALDFLSIPRSYPTGAGLKLDADEMAHAFVQVANVEQDSLRAALERYKEEVARLRRDEASSLCDARTFLEQRQEMAAERFEWQERAIRAEEALSRLRGER